MLNLKRPKNIHACLKQRCTNPNNKSYKYYGGRGIGFCKQWSSFQGFWADMSEGYSEELTIDRIDNNKGYFKENCRWTTQTEQKKNRQYRFSNYNWKTRNPEYQKLLLAKKKTFLALRNDGWTLQKIGTKFNLSRERVRQILL